jgi:phosphinothricin acetyltransferase
MIRHAAMSDADVIAGIYNYYVVNTAITFEEEMLSADQMAKRIGEVTSAALPWLVAEQSGRVVGYAYASKWKTRSAYRFSVESAIYLQDGAGGKGVGGKLYGELLPALKECGVHVVIGGIALPNQSSVALHEKFGFRKVAHFEEVGFKFGRWLDVGYWQKVL